MDTINTETASGLPFDEVAHRLQSNLVSGLTWSEAEKRCQLIGYNELCVKLPESLLYKYLEQVRIFFPPFQLWNLITVCFL